MLIVGGGIAGLALARMLARIGVSPEVIEREPVWRPAGTGMYLPGNATRALRALGLDTQVARRSVEIPSQRFCDHRGRLLCEVDVTELWGPVGPCLAIHRAELHDLLLEATGDVPIRLGQAVDGVTQRDGIVFVEYSDGTSGEYDLVVAADGINSAVRRLTFEPAPVPRPVGQVGWRFVAARPPEVTTWSVMLGRRTAFLTVPIGDDRVYCYCDVVSPRDPDSAERGPAERLTQLFAEYADPATHAARHLRRCSGHPRLGDRGGRPRLLGAWPRRADRRRRARDLAEHGARRGDGARGRARARPLSPRHPSDPRRPRDIRGPTSTPDRLGLRPDPPPRPHPIPPAHRQGQRPAIARAEDLLANYRPHYASPESRRMIGLLIAGNTVEGQEGGADYFAADKVWR